MLYDNALLLRLYAQALVVLEAIDQGVLAGRYGRVIDETVGWLRRQMSAPGGGFYAALDADSEGVEGKYYVWNPEEVAALVGPEKAASGESRDSTALGVSRCAGDDRHDRLGRIESRRGEGP